MFNPVRTSFCSRRLYCPCQSTLAANPWYYGYRGKGKGKELKKKKKEKRKKKTTNLVLHNLVGQERVGSEAQGEEIPDEAVILMAMRALDIGIRVAKGDAANGQTPCQPPTPPLTLGLSSCQVIDDS